MNNYSISYGTTKDDIINIKYEIKDLKESVLFLQLPAWRPGRYELGNFAQNVFSISVIDSSGKDVPYRKIKKDKWRIDTEGLNSLIVSYDYAAVIKNAGGTFKTEDSLVLTPVNCLLYAESKIFQECKVSVDVPEGFELASSLEGKMMTENYFELAASPLVYSRNIHRKTIQEKGKNFHICFEGNVDPDWEKIIPDFQKFIVRQLDLFGDFMSDDYYFLNLIFPEKHYHGVEHLHSTLIALGPDTEFSDPKFYQNLLGISSHELFHYWNICRIRPLEMMPYNYGKENYFETGYVAEGVTTYYGDFILGNCDSFTQDQTLEELAGTVNRHLMNSARYKVSVTESSIDLWLDGYKKGVPGRKVSIYAKGASIAWVLDLWILKSTNNSKSLDDVMRLMWTRFGLVSRGYSSKDYQDCIEEVVGETAQWYFDELVNGIVPVEDYLVPLLELFGMNLLLSEVGSSFYERFGIELQESNGSFYVSGKSNKALEAKDIEVGDLVLTLSNEKMEKGLIKESLSSDYLAVGVKRNERIISRSLSSSKYESVQKWQVKKFDSLTPEQEKNYGVWLKR